MMRIKPIAVTVCVQHAVQHAGKLSLGQPPITAVLSSPLYTVLRPRVQFTISVKTDEPLEGDPSVCQRRATLIYLSFPKWSPGYLNWMLEWLTYAICCCTIEYVSHDAYGRAGPPLALPERDVLTTAAEFAALYYCRVPVKQSD